MAVSAPWELRALPGLLPCVGGTRFFCVLTPRIVEGRGYLWGLQIQHQKDPGGLGEEKGARGVSTSIFPGCFPFLFFLK